jgi:hypothetical protein
MTISHVILIFISNRALQSYNEKRRPNITYLKALLNALKGNQLPIK